MNYMIVTGSTKKDLLRLRGVHALKTGIASICAYWIVTALGFGTGLIAIISVLISMQGMTIAESLKNGLNRFTGIGAGVLAGIVFLYISPESYDFLLYELFFITAVGSFLTHYGQRYTLATTVLCTILLAGINSQENDFQLAINAGLSLVAEASIGLGVAFIASTLIFPTKLRKLLQKDLEKECKNIIIMLESVMQAYSTNNIFISDFKIEDIYAQTWQHHEYLENIVTYESRLYNYPDNILEAQIKAINCSIDAARDLIDALNEYDTDYTVPPLAEDFQHLQKIIGYSLLQLVSKNLDSASFPAYVRQLDNGVRQLEHKIRQLQRESVSQLPFDHAMQLISFYHTLKRLAEDILIAMYDIQKGLAP